MIKKLLKKLTFSRGETLVETMAAILIFTLSSIILLSMIATASKLNSAAKESDKAIADELYVAEAQSKVDDTDDFVITSQSGVSQTVNITRFSSGEGKLYSYSYKD